MIMAGYESYDFGYGKKLKSKLPKVSDENWTKFVQGMTTALPSAMSASNSLGMFEMRPRRLEDLGFMTNLSQTRDSKTGKIIWNGDFVAPLTRKSFLASPSIQYLLFSESMKQYVESIADKSIVIPKEINGITLSGALAVLHRCGPSGLDRWKEPHRRFPETIFIYESVNGVF